MAILAGQVLINGVDIWTRYGVFLTEEKKGGLDNLAAILAPSQPKQHTGVDIREQNGKRYSNELDVASEERKVTLWFAQYASTKAEWLRNYADFIRFLKTGQNGWLSISFPSLDLTLRVFCSGFSNYKPLTYLWQAGKQASKYKVTFTEPNPTF